MVNFVEWENGQCECKSTYNGFKSDFTPVKTCRDCGAELVLDRSQLEKLKQSIGKQQERLERLQFGALPSDLRKYRNQYDDCRAKLIKIDKLLVEGRVEGKFQEVVEGRVEGKFQEVVEGRVEGKFQEVVEGKVEGKFQEVVEGRVEGKFQEVVEGKVEGTNKKGWYEIQNKKGGSYKYYRWRENGVKRSKYLGKV